MHWTLDQTGVSFFVRALQLRYFMTLVYCQLVADFLKSRTIPCNAVFVCIVEVSIVPPET